MKFQFLPLLFVLSFCSSGPSPQTSTSANNGKISSNEIRSDYVKGEISKLCKASIAKAQISVDAIAATPMNSRNIDNTLLALEESMAILEQETSPLVFMKDVHVNEKIREESLACANEINPFLVATFLRKDLYAAVKDVKPRSWQEKRLFNETIKSFENNGLKLADDKLAELKKLKEELAKIETDFDNNIAEDKQTVLLSAEELKGAQDSFIQRLKKDASGKYIVTMSYPDIFGTLQNVSVSETRKKVNFAFMNKASQKNLPLLKRAVELRQDIAERLGYKTWADYKTSQNRMAKSSKEVWNFLNELRGKLKIGNQRDLAAMEAFKKQLDPQAGPITAWDLRYLDFQLKKKKYSLDEEKIREYFPSEKTVEGMFNVYSTILGVNFERVADAKTWSPDVQFYKIIDKKTKETVAFFYTDFIPREGKYSHAAAFPLRSGRLLSDGTYLKPIAAIVANFNPPSGDKPSLLSHDEVETLFHEFGHIMHQTLTKAPYASFSGTSVARDFVEAPSQMLENWVWDPKVLSSISGHYKDSKKKLPTHLLKQMIAARDFNQSYFYTRQLWLGNIDMAYHSNPGAQVDTTAIQQKLHKEITGVEAMPGTHFEAGFGHLMGYDAGYYGYLWSEVYAQDMFTVFQKGGLLSPKVGAHYRKVILEQGGMKDALDLVKEFLGRNPSPKPFYKRLKI